MDNKPTISHDTGDTAFWTRPKKLLAGVFAFVLLISGAKACSGSRPSIQPITTSPLISSDEVRRLKEDRKRLEEIPQEQKPPSVAALTPPQQKALEARPAPAPKQKKPRETTSFISFRDAMAVHDDKAVATPRTVAAVEPVERPAEDPKSAVDDEPNLASAVGEKYRIRQGTLIPCTQMIRVNGSLTGHINCLISFPLYSTGGSHELIPKGSLALGKVESLANQTQQRLIVTFQKIIMPDGYTITMKDAADGLDEIGQTGLRDKVDHHYGQIFGAGLALAAVGGLAQIGNNGGGYSVASQYRIGFTVEMSQNSMRVLNRFISVLPTFIIREGARNNLYLPGDLLLPDYQNHTMPRNM